VEEGDVGEDAGALSDGDEEEDDGGTKSKGGGAKDAVGTHVFCLRRLQTQSNSRFLGSMSSSDVASTIHSPYDAEDLRARLKLAVPGGYMGGVDGSGKLAALHHLLRQLSASPAPGPDGGGGNGERMVVGTDGWSSPRHQTHFELSFLEQLSSCDVSRTIHQSLHGGRVRLFGGAGSGGGVVRVPRDADRPPGRKSTARRALRSGEELQRRAGRAGNAAVLRGGRRGSQPGRACQILPATSSNGYEP